MDERVTIRVETDLSTALEKLVADGTVPARSRQEAFRYIVRDWLTARGHLQHAPSAGREILELPAKHGEPNGTHGVISHSGSGSCQE